jgi:hypothetical protein
MTKSRSRVEDEDILSGWKEIADFLQTTTKSAHRWEQKDDLPILRPGHGRKGPVFASKRALRAWRTGGIADAIIADNRLIVFDRKARLLWAYEFLEPLPRFTADELKWRLRFIDIHGNGDRGVLLAIHFLDASKPGQIWYFSSEGKIEWMLEPKPDLRKLTGEAFENAWAITHLIAIPEAVGQTIFIAMANHAGWGGCILCVDGNGKPTVQFANTGYVESFCAVGLPDDRLFVICGENNDFDCAFAALLGVDDPPSCSIPGNRTVYRFANAPGDLPRKYILFPRTELVHARKWPYGHAQHIRQYRDRVIIEVETSGDGGFFLFHFNELLEPMYVFPSGSHEEFHKSLEATGEIGHPWLQCPEMRKPLVLKVWTRNSGWREQEIPWRDNPWKDDPGD